MRRIIFITLLVAHGVMAARLALAAPNWAPKDVEFSVNPGLGTLLAHTNNQGCTRGQGARKGCLRFEKDSIGQITFSLMGQPGSNKCSDAGTKYVITEVELSHVGYLVATNTGNQISDKGLFDQPVPAWLQAAFPGVDVNGVAYSATKEAASSQARIINLNNNDNASGTNAKDVWYRITVTNCSDDSKLRSDPRIENEGTG